MSKFSVLFLGLFLSTFAQSQPTATLTASDAKTNPGFLGQSVVISGSTVAVGAPNAVEPFTMGAIYVFTKPSSAQWSDMHESAILVAGNYSSRAGGIGTSIGMSGDGSIIVAGQSGLVAGFGPQQSAVLIFVRPVGGWAGTIHPSAALLTGTPAHPWITVADALNGVGINSKGDTIVAVSPVAGTTSHGSKGSIPGLTAVGAVFVWTVPVGGWATADGLSPTAELTAADGISFDQINSVSISGNTIAAGSTLAPYPSGKGAVYLFTKPKTGWHGKTGAWTGTIQFQSKVTASDAANNSGFGAALALANGGDLLAVGSQKGCMEGVAGEAYVFVRPAAHTWPAATTETAQLSPSDETGWCFGRSISATAGSILVGAPNVPSEQGGVSYLFTQNSVWDSVSQAANATGPGSTQFGISNSIGGRTFALGAPYAEIDGSMDAGAVYLYSN